MSCPGFAVSPNPRQAHCLRCGKAEGAHPRRVPVSRPRNIELEREITEHATRGVVDPSGLIEFAEARASEDHGYGQTRCVRVGVDWLHAGREEAADWRNYLCWWAQENPEHPRLPNVLAALRHVAIAYALVSEED